MHYMEASSMIADIGTRTKGLMFCLIGFEYYPDIKDAPTGILLPQSRRMLATKLSISALAKDWFGMNITAASSLVSANGDILIKLKSKLDLSKASWGNRPLIIMDDGTLTPRKEEPGLFYLSQP